MNTRLTDEQIEAKRVPLPTPPMVQTPWGPAHYGTKYADDVWFYSTAGHGGFMIGEKVHKTWNEALQSYYPFAGPTSRCFEEDCDWAIVALAMPDLFTARDIAFAVNTARMMVKMQHGRNEESITRFFNSDEGQRVQAFADAWRQQMADDGYYHKGSGYTETIDGVHGWVQVYRPYNTALETLIAWAPTDFAGRLEIIGDATRIELENYYGRENVGKELVRELLRA